MAATDANNNPWLPQSSEGSSRQLRLFCLPHAGGGASTFTAWRREMTPEIAVLPVQLPGREERLHEPPLDFLPTLVDALQTALDGELQEPYALFGHSMGGIVAFELARTLRDADRPLPVEIFISACRAAHLPRREEDVADLPDRRFLDALANRYQALPEAVRGDAEMMQIVAGILRADVRALENYHYEDGPPLDCPITAIGGKDDPLVNREDLAAWGKHTGGRFSVHRLPGDHFFINNEDSRRLVLGLITEELEPYLSR